MTFAGAEGLKVPVLVLRFLRAVEAVEESIAFIFSLLTSSVSYAAALYAKALTSILRYHISANSISMAIFPRVSGI